MKPFELTPDGKLKPRIFLGAEPAAEVLAELERMRYLTSFAYEQANRAMRGHRVRITKKWHDQQFGRSKANLIGKEYPVRSVLVADWHDGISLWLDGLACAIPLDYVELL